VALSSFWAGGPAGRRGRRRSLRTALRAQATGVCRRCRCWCLCPVARQERAPKAHADAGTECPIARSAGGSGSSAPAACVVPMEVASARAPRSHPPRAACRCTALALEIKRPPIVQRAYGVPISRQWSNRRFRPAVGPVRCLAGSRCQRTCLRSGGYGMGRAIITSPAARLILLLRVYACSG